MKLKYDIPFKYELITSSDLRVIKWLTGMTVDCDFVELEFINEKWRI